MKWIYLIDTVIDRLYSIVCLSFWLIVRSNMLYAWGSGFEPIVGDKIIIKATRETFVFRMLEKTKKLQIIDRQQRLLYLWCLDFSLIEAANKCRNGLNVGREAAARGHGTEWSDSKVRKSSIKWTHERGRSVDLKLLFFLFWGFQRRQLPTAQGLALFMWGADRGHARHAHTLQRKTCVCACVFHATELTLISMDYYVSSVCCICRCSFFPVLRQVTWTREYLSRVSTASYHTWKLACKNERFDQSCIAGTSIPGNQLSVQYPSAWTGILLFQKNCIRPCVFVWTKSTCLHMQRK